MPWVDYKKATNAGAVSLSAGADWTDVCSVQYETGPATFLLTGQWIATAGLNPGEFRLVAGAEVLPDVMPAPTGGAHGGQVQSEKSIATAGTYTFKLQCRPSNVILSSLNVAAGAAKIRAERVTPQ